MKRDAFTFTEGMVETYAHPGSSVVAMSDSPYTDTEDGESAPCTDVRLVLGVAMLFALLGALLARVAAGGGLDGVLGGAFAFLAVTAAVAVFGADVVRTVSGVLRP